MVRRAGEGPCLRALSQVGSGCGRVLPWLLDFPPGVRGGGRTARLPSLVCPQLKPENDFSTCWAVNSQQPPPLPLTRILTRGSRSAAARITNALQSHSACESKGFLYSNICPTETPKRRKGGSWPEMGHRGCPVEEEWGRPEAPVLLVRIFLLPPSSPPSRLSSPCSSSPCLPPFSSTLQASEGGSAQPAQVTRS